MYIGTHKYGLFTEAKFRFSIKDIFLGKSFGINNIDVRNDNISNPFLFSPNREIYLKRITTLLPTNDISFDFWIKCVNNSTNYCNVLHYYIDNKNDNSIKIQIKKNNGEIFINLFVNNTIIFNNYSLQNINNIDNWFHISFQIDQTIENKIKIYINGQLENYSNINNILTISTGILEFVEYNNVNQIINLAEL